MRLICFGIVLVFLTGLAMDRTNAQIPERTLFQPGSFAYGPYLPQNAVVQSMPMYMVESKLVEAPESEDQSPDGDDSDDSTKTEWEKNFECKKPKEKVMVEKLVPVQLPDYNGFGVVCGTTAAQAAPYLAWHRCPITHRVHLVPYQKGYVGAEDQFPKHQSHLNLCLSSLPCRTQNRPQVKYLGYYDAMPTIIEDKPSRLQLLLGYPDAQWTSCCENRWGGRLAQCPGVDPVAMGPYAEPSQRQLACQCPPPDQPLGGVFQGPRSINYGPMGPPPRQGMLRRQPGMPMPPNQGLCPEQIARIKPGPYPYISACPQPRELCAKGSEPCPCNNCCKNCEEKKPCKGCKDCKDCKEPKKAVDKQLPGKPATQLKPKATVATKPPVLEPPANAPRVR